MPTFYNYTENGVVYSFDDVFVPADAFRQGTLFGWGTNTSSQLGDNTAVNRSTPITTFAGSSNWKQISTGSIHTAAIKTDGTLWTWGAAANGRLGTNDATNRPTPVTTFAGGTNWKQVACAFSHTLAIKTDGTLWAWGNNTQGQLGDNTSGNDRTTPVTTFSGGTNWKQVAGGASKSAAIKTDGTLWTWGYNAYGDLGANYTSTNRITPITTFAGGTNWKQCSCGSYHIAAVKTDGTLWIWGRNNVQQLGDNTSANKPTPITTFAGGNNWKQVNCSTAISSSTAAVKNDGTLWTWGTNSNGQLGTNDASQRPTPVTTFAGGTNWKQVHIGQNNSVTVTAAIKTDGTLWTWGAGASGQLGDNTSVGKSTPVTTFAGGTNWRQVSCGGAYVSAITYIDDYQ